ncbi:MAG TPA: KUP/HAK/KT family potassium transporter, partial [Thermoanaerobaculia bacterium]|jgi:KUP system potassium uptake protein|nr:KUP/HAK/KT family potassium transporter [Thermoanaerobaculia bacterium]
VERERWNWSLIAVLSLTIPILIIDLSFFGANIIKVEEGGWFPLVIGALIFTAMTTWARGRQILAERLKESMLSTDDLLRDLKGGRIPRVPGTAIFLSRQSDGVPTTLLHNLKHNKVVHQRVILLSVSVEESPHLQDQERFEYKELGEGVSRLVLRFGFMEDPDLPKYLERLSKQIGTFNPMTTSYFLGRETLVATKRPGMAIWRERLFGWMMRNSSSAAQYFSLPTNQIIELGAQIEM